MAPNLINISVGQCGIGLGLEWLQSLCEEHGIGPDGYSNAQIDLAQDNKDIFFYQADNEQFVPRAIIADLEPRVIETFSKSQYGSLFNPDNIFQSNDGGGAGNRWYSGYEQGEKARDDFSDIVQREAENSDSLGGFIMSHSVSGGTGSGFGSYTLEMLRDLFPKKLVETYSVFPSASQQSQNDGVRSPYNAVLTLGHLQEFADAVIVVDNSALHRLADEICQTVKGYDEVNKMVSTILMASTAPIRFYSSTYNSFSDHIAELCSFDPMHFIQPGYAPFQLPNMKPKIIKTSAKEIISKLLKPSSMMVTTTPTDKRKDQRHDLLSGLAIFQGNIGDVNVDQIVLKMEVQQKFTYPPWSGTRLGTAVCNPSPYIKRENKVSGLLLANHTSISNLFDQIQTQFSKMYAKKAFFDFDDAEANLKACEDKLLNLINFYDSATRPDFLEQEY